ncbi:hypothetical protein [Reyranella sp.]
MTDEKLATWQARAFIAVQDPALRGQCPGCGFRILRLVLRAALNMHTSIPGKIEVPTLGDNAIISLTGSVWTRWTDERVSEPRPICTADELTAAVAWLFVVIDATAKEQEEILNTMHAWISRDERKMSEHIERQRESWKH